MLQTSPRIPTKQSTSPKTSSSNSISCAVFPVSSLGRCKPSSKGIWVYKSCGYPHVLCLWYPVILVRVVGVVHLGSIMCLVNITLLQYLLLSLLIPHVLSSSIPTKPSMTQRSAPRAVPYVSQPNDIYSASVSDTFPARSPGPDESIGQYLDTDSIALAKNGSTATNIGKRNLIRTKTLLESTWFDGQTSYNISIQRCITFDTVAGIWTFANGTVKENATLLDINTDFHDPPENTDFQTYYGSRVLANANAYLTNAEQYLHTQICDYDYTANPMNDLIHDELRRKLLGVDGYWIATLYKSSISGTVAAGVYAGFFNPHNHTTAQVVAAGVATAGVTFMIGVIDRLQLRGRLSATEASIISVLAAWYNQALYAVSTRQVGADTAVSGQNPCFPTEVVESAMKNLANYYDVEMGFDPQLGAVLGCNKGD